MQEWDQHWDLFDPGSGSNVFALCGSGCGCGVLMCLHSSVWTWFCILWTSLPDIRELRVTFCGQKLGRDRRFVLLITLTARRAEGRVKPLSMRWENSVCVPRFLIEGSLTSAPAGCDGSFSVSAWLGYGAQIFGPMLMWMFVWRCFLTKRESNVWSVDFEESGIFCNVDGPLFTWRPEQSKDWHPI